MVQAIDKMSGRYVGRFLDADGLYLLDECSAVMQNDNKSKTNIQLAWVAPLNQRGDVMFRNKRGMRGIGFQNHLQKPLSLEASSRGNCINDAGYEAAE
ncbi:reelin domain-containing protein [Caerostris extrusa]|uniref:Reelin domain-containing protein n=1 Tax=Caerostris extrusa TaxID=172846 RepID=A0AAV4RAU0_CAEEX|nr:reelin domain-containing protein [Caerostris extrusa]